MDRPLRNSRALAAGLAALFSTFVCFAVAAAPSEATKAEIAHLFNHLKSSGCKFNRNGKWHSAEAASEHLQTKYDYLLKRNMIASTEMFIERAAAGSSTSGRPYQVQCAATAPVESAAWFNAELARYRAKSGSR